jgi:hypothetical protein
MFDVDIMPLCVAPFVTIVVAVFVFTIGSLFKRRIEKKTGERQNGLNTIITLICISSMPIVCALSTYLNIGTEVPHPWLKPSTFDVSGQWTFSKCTSHRFKEQWSNFSNVPGKIEFKNDHTFMVENLPAPWGLNDHSDLYTEEYISSGSGKWYIETTSGRLGGDEWMLYAQFQEINQAESNRLVGFYFDGQLPPYNLAYSENINLVVLTKGRISLEDYLCP